MPNRFVACAAIAWLMLSTLVLGPATLGPAAARADEPGDSFQAVISAQVAAFRRDDWTAAFSYASPGIRAQLQDPDAFRRMVKQGYRPVARPQVFEFEAPTVIDGRPTQPVFVVGPDGTAHRALYFMEQQSDGSWRIGGCVLLPLADRTT